MNNSHLILLSLLIVVLANRELVEKFSSRKGKKCSARFNHYCDNSYQSCRLSRTTPRGYVSLPVSTDTSSSNDDEEYLAVSGLNYIKPPLCSLDNMDGWTNPISEENKKINLERQASRSRGGIFNDKIQMTVTKPPSLQKCKQPTRHRSVSDIYTCQR